MSLCTIITIKILFEIYLGLYFKIFIAKLKEQNCDLNIRKNIIIFSIL